MIDWKTDWRPLAWIAAVFAALYFLPVGHARFDAAVVQSLSLAKWYAREHVLLCLVPAFFIAGAISVFVSQAAVIKYLGAKANRAVAYAVASVSGSILAVCSCTVLPLFAGIRKRGAGLGPATAFLYSGPAINVLAIVLTARLLGIELGIARAVGAIVFSVVIGVLMQLIFRKGERKAEQENGGEMILPDAAAGRPLWQTGVYFATMVGVLVFANWASPVASGGPVGAWGGIHSAKWLITSAFAAGLAVVLALWFKLAWWRLLGVAIPTAALAMVFPATPQIAFAAGAVGLAVLTATGGGESREWFGATWGFAKQILPLLLAGVLVAGLLLGGRESGGEGLIPRHWVAAAVGGNSLAANLFASVAGAFMYFATLTEVPILRGLLDAGMGRGPALALLLAGPALGLPNMLVIRSVLGTARTVVYVLLVIVMATISGLLFGLFFG